LSFPLQASLPSAVLIKNPLTTTPLTLKGSISAHLKDVPIKVHCPSKDQMVNPALLPAFGKDATQDSFIFFNCRVTTTGSRAENKLSALSQPVFKATSKNNATGQQCP